MNISGLNELEFKYIKNALKSCHCIGIETCLPDYCEIWCTRVGMGMYSYRIYLRPLDEEEQTYYLNDCHCIPYNDHVLFMFDSSIGTDTFTKEQREHYLNEFQWALDKNTNTAGTKTKKGRPSESTSQKIIQQHRLT